VRTSRWWIAPVASRAWIAVARGAFGLVADALDRVGQRFAGVEVQVHQQVRPAEALAGQQLPQLALRQHRRVEHHVVHILGTVVEDVAFLADLRGQRHHAVLAQRVDRRVGDLRERLAEAVVQRADALAQDRHRHVVAHRADAFLLGLGQRTQHRLLLLAAELETLLERQQFVRRERFGGQRRVDQFGVQPAHPLLEPLLVRRPGTVDLVDRIVVQQNAAFEVDRDHLARAELALRAHPVHRQVADAGLGGDDEHAVGRQRPARGPQAVAVERARGVAPIAHHHAGRAVPRLGIDRVVLVERSEVGVLVLQRLGRRRDQDAHRLGDVHAAEQQPLEHVVERLRVRAVGGHRRVELADVEQRRPPGAVARLRPQPVALDAVDLAVVRQPPERMRQRPARQGVGREALVEHDAARRQLRPRQVRVQLPQVAGQHHALVPQQARRQRHHVVVGDLAQLLFAAPAGKEQRAVERVAVVAIALDEDLFDARHRRPGLLAAGGIVGGNLAPAGDAHADLVQAVAQRVAATLRLRRIARQEHVAGRAQSAMQGVAGLRGEGAHEAVGAMQEHAAAVARQSVGGDAAAMRHARQRFQRGVDDRARTLAPDLCDQAESAAVVFACGVV
jgi:hypothetical protein